MFNPIIKQNNDRTLDFSLQKNQCQKYYSKQKKKNQKNKTKLLTLQKRQISLSTTPRSFLKGNEQNNSQKKPGEMDYHVKSLQLKTQSNQGVRYWTY